MDARVQSRRLWREDRPCPSVRECRRATWRRSKLQLEQRERKTGSSISLHGSERLNSRMQVHVVGAGPVGLMLTALLQSMEGLSVRLYEKRREYTRTRMVQLAPYLVADSVESYRADAIDGDSVEAIFDPSELEQGLAFRQSIPPDLTCTPQSWVAGVLPAQLHRALPQRSDRCARAERGGAHRRGRDGGGRDGDARTGRRPHRLPRAAGPCFEITSFPAPAR